MSVLQDLYDSEINISISTFWDGGFDVKLGDEMNGFWAETTVRRFGEIEPWVVTQVVEKQPGSLFAKMYGEGKSRAVALREIRGLDLRVIG